MNGTIRYTIRPYDTIWMLAQVFNTTVDSIMELNPGIDPRNLFVGQVVTIQPGLQNYPSFSEQEDEDVVEGQDLEDLTGNFRLLWEQHVEWTRMAIMAIIYDIPGSEFILRRLLRNPVDFATVLMPYYGEEAAQSFSDLLTAHLTIAAEVVTSAKAGDNDAYTNAEKRWYDNAEQIAEFLGSINSYWNEDDWSAMMSEHLNLLAANVGDLLAEDYEESVNGFDDIELQALEMADMMAQGIAMQFPD